MADIATNTLQIGSNNLILQDAAVRSSLANAYSASSTYAVGDMVLKDGQLYECNTAISTAEAWTAAHWTAVTVGGELATVKDGFNDLKEEYTDILNSAYVTDIASGSIASFPDGADSMPVKSLSVDIEPVQDLHGYDNPWPAGGGKNLLNASADSGSSNGVTYTKNENGTYTLNGTANGAFALVVGSIELVANTQYILSGCPSNGGGSTYNVRIRDSSYVALGFDTGTEAIITPSETKTYYYQITVNSGTTVSNLLFKPMIRLASVTDGTYAPYSNICPINGRTAVTVTRTGFNVWDEEWEVGGFVWSTGLPSSDTNRYRSKNYIPCFPNTPYYCKGGLYRILFYDKNKTYLEQENLTNINNILFITPQNAYYMNICDTSKATYNHDISINYPATEHDYHAGHVQTVEIPLGQTVYGGTLDVTQGVLSVTQANITSYSGETLPGIWISSMDVYTAGGTPTTGAQVVYELATPITVQLTAQQLTTLLGQNNVWSDADSVSVEYRADTKLYIEKLTAPTEDDMVADHAISANSFFMVGNTLYRATTAIASGATITLGTNATKLSLSDALNALS